MTGVLAIVRNERMAIPTIGQHRICWETRSKRIEGERGVYRPRPVDGRYVCIGIRKTMKRMRVNRRVTVTQPIPDMDTCLYRLHQLRPTNQTRISLVRCTNRAGPLSTLLSFSLPFSPSPPFSLLFLFLSLPLFDSLLFRPRARRYTSRSFPSSPSSILKEKRTLLQRFSANLAPRCSTLYRVTNLVPWKELIRADVDPKWPQFSAFHDSTNSTICRIRERFHVADQIDIVWSRRGNLAKLSRYSLVVQLKRNSTRCSWLDDFSVCRHTRCAIK